MVTEATSAELARTPLYAWHVRAGARMVDFGGWLMPLSYGSQLEEHHAVRRHAGLFDVSHMRVLDIDGTQAQSFLRVLLANDVAKLAQGQALYSCMLGEAGGVIDDLIVYAQPAGRYRLVVNAGTAEKDVAWMRALAARGAGECERFDVTIQVREDLAILAVQGPQALALTHAALARRYPQAAQALAGLKPFWAATLGDVFVARTGYTGEDGCEIALPADQAEALWSALVDAGVRPCGLGARDTLRLEAGMALWGQDIDEQVSPLDAGLAWTVDMKTERAFIGRRALEQNGQSHAFVGIKLLDKGVLRAHQCVSTAQGEGEITSGSFSPTLGFAIGMARVPLGARVGDRVSVDVRGKALPAQVVNMPFVRHGKALV